MLIDQFSFIISQLSIRAKPALFLRNRIPVSGVVEVLIPDDTAILDKRCRHLANLIDCAVESILNAGVRSRLADAGKETVETVE